MKKQTFSGSSDNTRERHVYLERPRINKLLSEAVEDPLIVVCAGAGYGKSQAVSMFLHNYDGVVSWVQLSERDNMATLFWENFSHTVSFQNKRLATRLMEIGFPNTEELFAKYLSLSENEIHLTKKSIIIFDDFHLLKNPAVLKFIERTIHAAFPYITTFIISRTEPSINIVKLISKDKVTNLTEDELRFTEDECAQYFKLLNVPLSSESIANIHDDTAGWAFALSLLSLPLKKAPSQERVARAAMKLNIFKMMEDEVFLVISEKLQRFLVRLSLINHLVKDLVMILADDASLIEEMEKVSSFIRYDMYLNSYSIHNLFLDYLRKKHNILTDDEKRETYLAAGDWSRKFEYKMDAISYYDKAGNYEAIIDIIRLLPPMMPFSQAKFVLDIYENASLEVLNKIAPFHIQYSRLLICIGRYKDAVDWIKKDIAEYSELPPSDFNNRILCGAYAALGVFNHLIAPQTNVYDFDLLFAKAEYYYNLSPYVELGPVSGISVGTWASKVGTTDPSAMEDYISALERAIPHISNILNGFMYGLDELAKGELLFYKCDLKAASAHINQAIIEAKEKKQHEVHNRALFNFLRIAAAKGDFEQIQSVLQELETQLEIGEYAMRYVTHDIISSWLYNLIGQTELVAKWLKSDFEEETLPIFSVYFGNFVKIGFFYMDKRYHELLSFLHERRSSENVLFEKLEFKIFEALCYYRTKQKKAAFSAMEEAYELAKTNELYMPFIEFGKDMRSITIALMRDKNNNIPRDWLEMINRKSATYAKRLLLIISKYKKANNLGDDIALSPRELILLNDLYHGLSRSEIAHNHNLSINTVKLVLNTVYTKLGADSLADVIRIALDKKLLK
jgi:LuxR family maltose regulon positive regulatory protein